jgi:hypothetical protein
MLVSRKNVTSGIETVITRVAQSNTSYHGISSRFNVSNEMKLLGVSGGVKKSIYNE